MMYHHHHLSNPSKACNFAKCIEGMLSQIFFFVCVCSALIEAAGSKHILHREKVKVKTLAFSWNAPSWGCGNGCSVFYLFKFSLQNTHWDESPPQTLIFYIRQDRRSRVTATFPCCPSVLPPNSSVSIWDEEKNPKATQHHSVQTSVLPACALPQCSHGAFKCLKILPENNAFLW